MLPGAIPSRGIPDRGLPDRAWPLYGAGFDSNAEQIGAIPERGIPVGGVVLRGIPVFGSGEAPFESNAEQIGAIPERGVPTGGVVLRGIPVYGYVAPEIPEVPPVVIVTAEYGAGGIVISPIEGLKPKLIGRDITADDAEVMEMILTIIGALYE